MIFLFNMFDDIGVFKMFLVNSYVVCLVSIFDVFLKICERNMD